jgi:hypothetical protein
MVWSSLAWSQALPGTDSPVWHRLPGVELSGCGLTGVAMTRLGELSAGQARLSAMDDDLISESMR